METPVGGTRENANAISWTKSPRLRHRILWRWKPVLVYYTLFGCLKWLFALFRSLFEWSLIWNRMRLCRCCSKSLENNMTKMVWTAYIRGGENNVRVLLSPMQFLIDCLIEKKYLFMNFDEIYRKCSAAYKASFVFGENRAKIAKIFIILVYF